VYQLACVNKGGQLVHPGQTQFPIAETLTDFKKQEGKYLRELDSSHIAVIESYQPYHGIANRPDCWSGPYVHQLTLLQELSNIDKHRLLHTILLVPCGVSYALPIGIQVLSPDIKTADDFLQQGPFRHAGDELRPGVEVVRRKLVAQTGQYIPPSLSAIGFATPQISLEEKRPLIATLERLESFVELILDDFKARLS
jgi:hypothetical protein